MAFDLDKARDYVYRNGTLFERALFAWLFDGGCLERLWQIILATRIRTAALATVWNMT